jgi:hypothetical protein
VSHLQHIVVKQKKVGFKDNYLGVPYTEENCKLIEEAYRNFEIEYLKTGNDLVGQDKKRSIEREMRSLNTGLEKCRELGLM